MNIQDVANAGMAAADAAKIYGPAVIAGASAAAAFLPPPKEGTFWAAIRKLIDYAALNVLNAKNAPPVSK